jgi:hypothetical protein
MSVQILKRNGEYVTFTHKIISEDGKLKSLLTCVNCAWKTTEHDEMANHECKQKREKVKINE